MANEKPQDKQKVNQNGRSVYVISPTIKAASSEAQTASTYIGVLTNSTKLIEKNNFSWGLLHSKNTPPISFERLKKITNGGMHYYKPENKGNKVFRGNGSTTVSNVGKVASKIDKVGAMLGNAGDASEIAILVAEKDTKGLVVKASSMAGYKSGQKGGLALAGKVCPKLAKGSPQSAALIGATCIGAMFYAGNKVGDYAGKAVGNSKAGVMLAESDAAIGVVYGLVEAAEIIDAREKAADEKRRQEEIKKDPMLEWHILGAD